MPTYVCSWVLLQYSFALNALNERFTSLNKSLIKLGNISMKIPLQILFVKKIPLDHKVLSDIINIRLAYRILCEICDHVSDLFALPTLLGIIYFGSSTTYETYFILISFFTHDTTNINFARAGSLVWFSTQLYDIFILTISVTKIIREIKNTPTSIHLILDRCTTNNKIEEELTEFSRELFHRKVEFNVYGMFSLDCSLPHLVFGTVVTYLIILVQFQVKEKF
ncbi:hypothetical protein PV325_011152 [Microctonus aethiopoides]|nr:hypothetical protein PV325_011152 [Microctonus aethiopoides]